MIFVGNKFLGFWTKAIHTAPFNVTFQLKSAFPDTDLSEESLINSENPNFELIRHDIVDTFKTEVDQIFNLACPASPIHYQHNSIKTLKTSVMGAINTLGLAKRVGARILQASTSEVYGDPEVHPQSEDYWGNVNTIGPRAFGNPPLSIP